MNNEKKVALSEISRELESNHSMNKKCYDMVQSKKDLEEEVIGTSIEKSKCEYKVNKWLSQLAGIEMRDGRDDDE